MEVRIVELTDIHFGKTDEARLYSELEEVTFPYLETFKPDIVVIAGDLFDKRLSFNHPAVQFANKFVKRIQELCKTVLLIHGTLGHDQFQVDSYSHLVSENFRIYKVAKVDYVHGMKILILPEEYPADKENYYKEFFETEEQYDFVFGHGMFAHISSSGHESEKKNSVTWNAKEFDRIVYGRVVFGHIHKSEVYKKVIYPGSFTRMAHGEEEAKGFYSHVYNTVTKKIVSETFVENTKAPIYKTIQISSLPKTSTETISVLKEIYKTCDFLRIFIDEDPPKEVLHLVIGFARITPNVKLDNVKLKKPIASKMIESEEKKKENEFVKRVKGLNFRDATKTWAREVMDVEITDDVIDDAIIPV